MADTKFGTNNDSAPPPGTERVEQRAADLLPEEIAAGSDDPEAQARELLTDSDQRTAEAAGEATSTARVATDRPARYGKQLASHLGRRNVSDWSEDTGSGFVDFDYGRAGLTAEDGGLLLEIVGAADQIDRLEDVVGRHLVRFGTKDELVVQWSRGDGTPGSVQRNTSDAEHS